MNPYQQRQHDRNREENTEVYEEAGWYHLVNLSSTDTVTSERRTRAGAPKATRRLTPEELEQKGIGGLEVWREKGERMVDKFDGISIVRNDP